MPARLPFYVQLKDNEGDVVPGGSFYAYPTKAAADADTTWNGTGKTDLVDVSGVALSQPCTVDANGELWVYSESRTKIIVKAVGSTRPAPVFCAEEPDWSDAEVYATATPVGTDYGLFWDLTDGKIKRCLLNEFVAAGPAASYVLQEVYLGGNPPQSSVKLHIITGTPVVGDYNNGDVILKVPA